MDYLVEYDKSDPISIEMYSQRMIGKTFREICEEDDARGASVLREEGTSYGTDEVAETKRNKGNLGQIIEERFFHYACNSDARADFYEAGVELKVTPYRINQNGSLSAKERLILTMIDYYQVVNESFEESHFWNKSKLILLVYYLYMKEIKFNLDYKIGYSRLFTPPEQDVKIIRNDYELIVAKIKAGRAHELSESDTLYLGAAPKAATSQDRRKQPYSEVPAKPRAFAFKNSYMTYVLNNYIVPGKVTYEPIMQSDVADSFEDYVVEKIDRYCGRSVNDLCIEFCIEIDKKPKNLEAMLAYRMLGIKGNHAEEFEKANIVVKTIRIGKNDRIKESMSFPTFKYTEIVKETWLDSELYETFSTTKYLFMIYQYVNEDTLIFKKAMFWNVPEKDLNTEIKRVWEDTIERIKNNEYDNLPRISESPILHVARNAQDTYPTLDGKQAIKKCFWLNASYIKQQIEGE